METLTLAAWGDFPRLIATIRDRHAPTLRNTGKGTRATRRSEILFRGQADARWRLATTLERAASRVFSVEDYLQVVSGCHQEIASFTGTDWQVAPPARIRSELADQDDEVRPFLPHYPFLIYLRHHGFPSPLLDWSTSPYIAAFFAYSQASGAADPAIHCFVERPHGAKGGAVGGPRITTMGPHATTDIRHFSQKARYTIATRRDRRRHRHVFCPHEEVLGRDGTHPDLGLTIILPAAERARALQDLDDHNINHFTLFRDEDALIRLMAARSFPGDQP